MSNWKLLLLGVLTLPTVAADEFVPEVLTTEVLPDYRGRDWFWAYGIGVPHASESRSYLFDKNGTNLAQLNNGTWLNSMVFDHRRNEILTVETYFSRGTRGTRSDMVTVYDPQTMKVKEEILIPPKRMQSVKSTGASVLLDDGKFLIVTNYTPAQSVSVVDLQQRKFVGEIETPGCSVVYPAGTRDFYSICGNGGFLQIRLDDSGKVELSKRHAPIFDPISDFLTIAASRKDDTWYFVSFENNVSAIKMTADGLAVIDKWSLLSESEKADDWRISGQHHTAIHKAGEQLFVLMHQGDAHTFEAPGEEVWVYNLSSKKRVQRIELDDVAVSIGVSEGDEPTLYCLAYHVPLPSLFKMWIYLVNGEAEILKHVVQVVDLYDVESGKHRLKVGDIPYGALTVVQPW